MCWCVRLCVWVDFSFFLLETSEPQNWCVSDEPVLITGLSPSCSSGLCCFLPFHTTARMTVHRFDSLIRFRWWVCLYFLVLLLVISCCSWLSMPVSLWKKNLFFYFLGKLKKNQFTLADLIKLQTLCDWKWSHLLNVWLEIWLHEIERLWTALFNMERYKWWNGVCFRTH